VIADKKITAALLAQAVAQRSREPGAPPMAPTVAAVVDSTLKAIEQNTAAIEVNTKKE